MSASHMPNQSANPVRNVPGLAKMTRSSIHTRGGTRTATAGRGAAAVTNQSVPPKTPARAARVGSKRSRWYTYIARLGGLTLSDGGVVRPADPTLLGNQKNDTCCRFRKNCNVSRICRILDTCRPTRRQTTRIRHGLTRHIGGRNYTVHLISKGITYISEQFY